MPFYIKNSCDTRVFALFGDKKMLVEYKNIRVSHMEKTDFRVLLAIFSRRII